MRFRIIAPLFLALALSGCAKASDVAANPTDSASTTPTSSASSSASTDLTNATPATGEDLSAIRDAATKFEQAAAIADWKTVCELSVDKRGQAVAASEIDGCAKNYASQTGSEAAWAKLSKDKQAQILADAKTIEYTGTPQISGVDAQTDKSWNYKGAARTDGPQLTLKKIDGKWLVDTNNFLKPQPSASAS